VVSIGGMRTEDVGVKEWKGEPARRNLSPPSLVAIPRLKIFGAYSKYPVMSPKVIILTSVCLNVGLGIAYIISPKPPAGEATLEAVKADGNKSAVVKRGSSASPVVVTNVIEPEFHWREVEAADYKEYIAKLRGIGCPEATIRDIIIADIDKLYEPRIIALRDPPTYRPDQFWVSDMGNRSRKYDPEKAAQIAALYKERSELIKELLGADESDLRKAFNSYEDPREKQLAFLTQEQRDKIKELDKKFSEERSRIYAEAGGFIDGETQKELAAVRQKMLEGMKGFMTPGEIFDYDIRTSDIARNMKWELRGFNATEEEFKALFAVKKAEEEARYSRTGERPSPEEMKVLQEASKLAQDNLRTTLGEERYKEMELSKDYSYRQLVAAAPYLGFDAGAAARVSSVKTDAEKAANEIRRNRDLSPEARNQALQQIREAAEAAVTKEIGEKGYKYYRRQGGYWFNNIAPRATSTKAP